MNILCPFHFLCIYTAKVIANKKWKLVVVLYMCSVSWLLEYYDEIMKIVFGWTHLISIQYTKQVSHLNIKKNAWILVNNKSYILIISFTYTWILQKQLLQRHGCDLWHVELPFPTQNKNKLSTIFIWECSALSPQCFKNELFLVLHRSV